MNCSEIYTILVNIDFWSAFLGFFGSILIFFFGLPPRFDPGGHQVIATGARNEKSIKKGKIYKKISHFGILLIALSFLLQIIKLF